MSHSAGPGGDKGDNNTGNDPFRDENDPEEAFPQGALHPYQDSDGEEDEANDDSEQGADVVPSQAPPDTGAAAQTAPTGPLPAPRRYHRYQHLLTGRNLLWMFGESRRNPYTGVWEENPSPINGTDYARFMNAPAQSNPQCGWRKKARKVVPAVELTDTIAQHAHNRTYDPPQDVAAYNAQHPPDPTVPSAQSAPLIVRQGIMASIRQHRERQGHEPAINTPFGQPAAGGTANPPAASADDDDDDAVYPFITVNGVLYAKIALAQANGPEFWLFPGTEGTYVINDGTALGEPGILADPYDYMYFNGALYARVPPADNTAPEFTLEPGIPGSYVLKG